MSCATQRSRARPLPENTEDGHYEVERILGHCGRTARTLQYLVKWRGYDDSHNSWIRSEACNAPDLVAEYFSSAGMNEHEESDSPLGATSSPAPESNDTLDTPTDEEKFRIWLTDLGFDMRRLPELLKPGPEPLSVLLSHLLETVDTHSPVGSCLGAVHGRLSRGQQSKFAKVFAWTTDELRAFTSWRQKNLDKFKLSQLQAQCRSRSVPTGRGPDSPIGHKTTLIKRLITDELLRSCKPSRSAESESVSLVAGKTARDMSAQPTVTDESGCTPSVVESAGANEATVKKPSSRRRRTKKSRRSTSQTRPSTPVDRAYVAISEPAQNATVPMTSQSDMETVAWRQRYGFTVTPPSDDVLDVAPSQTLTQATTTPRLRQAWNRLGFPKGTDGNGFTPVCHALVKQVHEESN